MLNNFVVVVVKCVAKLIYLIFLIKKSKLLSPGNRIRIEVQAYYVSINL